MAWRSEPIRAHNLNVPGWPVSINCGGIRYWSLMSTTKKPYKIMKRNTCISVCQEYTHLLMIVTLTLYSQVALYCIGILRSPVRLIGCKTKKLISWWRKLNRHIYMSNFVYKLCQQTHTHSYNTYTNTYRSTHTHTNTHSYNTYTNTCRSAHTHTHTHNIYTNNTHTNT